MSKEKNTQVEEEVAYCVIERQTAINKIKEIEEAYRSVFDEYKMWMTVLNSPVNIIEEPK